MSTAKLAAASALVTIALSACGIAPKPVAGTPGIANAPGMRGQVDRLRAMHFTCILGAGLPARTYLAAGNRPAIQVGKLPTGPTIVFEPTPGAAQNVQIDGSVQGAEVIGSALVYPNLASDAVLSKVEACVAVGVIG